MEIWHIAATFSSSLLKESGICGQGLWQATKNLWSSSEQRGQVVLARKKEGNSWRSKSWKSILWQQQNSNFIGWHSCSRRNAWFSYTTQLTIYRLWTADWTALILKTLLQITLKVRHQFISSNAVMILVIYCINSLWVAVVSEELDYIL